jgi:hypothetical protein
MNLILYFSILLHCIVQWVLQVMFPSACGFILCWFSLSFTTCFGLHDHLQVYRIFHIFIFICLRILLRCFFWFAALFHVVTLWMFLICVLFLCCFPSCFFRVFLLMRLSACYLCIHFYLFALCLFKTDRQTDDGWDPDPASQRTVSGSWDSALWSILSTTGRRLLRCKGVKLPGLWKSSHITQLQ